MRRCSASRRRAFRAWPCNPFRKPKTSGYDWLISCGPANPGWQVTVGNCDKAHAESVLEQLKNDESCPSDLKLKRI